MYEEDRYYYIQRYEQWLREFGQTPQALGWGKHARQQNRFHVLAQMAIQEPNCSVLDVGCGFADLYDYLAKCGWRGKYTGIDIVQKLLEIAIKRHPDLELYQMDIADAGGVLDMHDYVIASGVFNAKLQRGDNYEHITESLKRMYELSNKAVCVDFLSSYVDYMKEDSFHVSPEWAFSEARKLSKRVTLRHDYMPYEFALYIYRDDTISQENVFLTYAV